MFLRAAKFFALIAAVQILGGHWAVLQSVAWARMFVDYGRRESLATALVKTFDPARPCELCRMVATGREKEQKQEATIVIVKTEAILAPAVALPPPAAKPIAFPIVTSMGCSRFSPPPTPPPRLA